MPLYDIAASNKDIAALLASIEQAAGSDIAAQLEQLWDTAHRAGKNDVIADLEAWGGLTDEGRKFLAENHAGL